MPNHTTAKTWLPVPLLTPGHANPFLKGPVGHFMPADTVPVAALNISVSSVARSNPQASAHPVTSNVPLCPETDQLLKILCSKPVTPVTVDRLDFLLHGYPDSLKHFLVSGFSCGFRICFVGERHSLESPNLKSTLEQESNLCIQQ